MRSANDTLADAVRRHPDRFAAFAALPTTVPDAAAAELDRCVGDLGFVGTMIMGRTEGEFLSAERFDPILRTAARLGVPIYLHPALPTRVTSADNYEAGLDPIVAARFASAAWGWHNETGIHFLHLVLSGVFDRYPSLQVILGHWGEMIPWFLDRLDEALPRRATKLERTIGDYVRQNSYYTPSGMFTEPHLRFCLDVLGADRHDLRRRLPVRRQRRRGGLPAPGRPSRRRQGRHRSSERRATDARAGLAARGRGRPRSGVGGGP